jgi:hypothetical protein
MNGGPVRRTKIGTLKLRIPAGSAHSARALAAEVAGKLAMRTDALRAGANDSVQARINLPVSLSHGRLTEAIVDGIVRRKDR